jgi:hypothetical protein
MQQITTQRRDARASDVGSLQETPVSQLTCSGSNTQSPGIDIRSEKVIRLSDVRNHLPPNAKGRKMDKSVAFRRASKGLRGHRLEYLQQGGVRVTSLEAVQRFFKKLTHAAPVADGDQTSRRQQEIEKADAQVKASLRRRNLSAQKRDRSVTAHAEADRKPVQVDSPAHRPSPPGNH